MKASETGPEGPAPSQLSAYNVGASSSAPVVKGRTPGSTYFHTAYGRFKDAERPRKKRLATDRFWLKVNKDGPLSVDRPESGPCWVWLGTTWRGYGKFWLESRTIPAHHFLVGPPADGFVYDHLCRTRSCVRPDHLEQVTNLINIRRGLAGIVGREKTHCPQGHEYTPENTYVARGRRTCKTCQRRLSRESYLRALARQLEPAKEQVATHSLKDRPAARVDACPACDHSWLAHGYRGGCQAECDDDPHWACGCNVQPERAL